VALVLLLVLALLAGCGDDTTPPAEASPRLALRLDAVDDAVAAAEYDAARVRVQALISETDRALDRGQITPTQAEGIRRAAESLLQELPSSGNGSATPTPTPDSPTASPTGDGGSSSSEGEGEGIDGEGEGSESGDGESKPEEEKPEEEKPEEKKPEESGGDGESEGGGNGPSSGNGPDDGHGN